MTDLVIRIVVYPVAVFLYGVVVILRAARRARRFLAALGGRDAA